MSSGFVFKSNSRYHIWDRNFKEIYLFKRYSRSTYDYKKFLNIEKKLHYSIKLNFLFPSKVHIALGHTWPSEYL